MKILILTSKFGMGHFCAAEAIKEELELKSYNDIINIVDIIEYVFPKLNKSIYGAFNIFISKVSWVYNFVNGLFKNNQDNSLNKRTLNRIDNMIKKYNPDLIISTWSACSKYISIYKNKFKKGIPLYTYITDISIHDGWITKGTNMYIVATKDTKDMLISKGISGKRIIINGIPVRECFKKDNHTIALNNKKEILIMGGGLGIIPDIFNILKGLNKENNLNVTVITGKNKKLFRKIKKMFPEIDVVGYTNKIDEYMRNADLLVTKPGGISTFEAIYSNTPLYIVTPVFSQEIGNAKFIEKNSIGKVAWQNGFNIANDIICLANNEALLENMKKNIKVVKSHIEEFKLKKVCKRNTKKCG